MLQKVTPVQRSLYIRMCCSPKARVRQVFTIKYVHQEKAMTMKDAGGISFEFLVKHIREQTKCLCIRLQSRSQYTGYREVTSIASRHRSIDNSSLLSWASHPCS